MAPQPADKPHILQVIPTLGPGGAERLLATYLAEPVLKEPFRHTVVMTDVADIDAEIPENFLVRALQQQGVQVIGLGLHAKARLPGCIRALYRLIRDQRCDMVHTHLLWANIAGRLAARWAGVPVVSSFHNSDYDPQVIAGYKAPAWKQDLIRRLDGWTTRRCVVKSVAVSQYVARHIQDRLGVRPADIEVIYNPVDFRQVQPASADPRGRIFGELGLSPESRLILSVGRVTEQKGILELVEAFAPLAQANPAAQLAVLGTITADPGYVQRVREKIALHQVENRVHLPGPRHDVADWLAAADIFAFPTKYEGLGIALAEAMAAGLACVATDVGPIPELISHEKNGLLVPYEDVPALSAAIARLLNDDALRRQLARQARADILKQLDPAEKSAELAALYNRFARRPG